MRLHNVRNGLPGFDTNLAFGPRLYEARRLLSEAAVAIKNKQRGTQISVIFHNKHLFSVN